MPIKTRTAKHYTGIIYTCCNVIGNKKNYIILNRRFRRHRVQWSCSPRIEILDYKMYIYYCFENFISIQFLARVRVRARAHSRSWPPKTLRRRVEYGKYKKKIRADNEILCALPRAINSLSNARWSWEPSRSRIPYILYIIIIILYVYTASESRVGTAPLQRPRRARL